MIIPKDKYLVLGDNRTNSHWLRFVWPVVAFVLIFGGGLLITQVLIYS
ncbi:hypothetical protein [Staphylococcus capitis]